MSNYSTQIQAIESFFVVGDFREALARSEDLRVLGVVTPGLAVMQAVCLDALGFAAAAEQRIHEIERAIGVALADVARAFIAARAREKSLVPQAMRRIPRLARGS